MKKDLITLRLLLTDHIDCLLHNLKHVKYVESNAAEAVHVHGVFDE